MNNQASHRALSGWPIYSVITCLVVPGTAIAQTDYYNTDRNRPARIEDASSVEHYAVELKLAPLRLERAPGGREYRWSIHPEIAYGVLPRTSIEVGFPVAAVEGGTAGLAGVELSVFRSLNVETRTVPALAVRGDLALPVGALGPNRAIPSLTAIMTRSFGGTRLHLNGRYAFASEDALPPTSQQHDETRWLVGVAADRALPLRALLMIVEIHAERPLDTAERVRWNAGGGVRYQWNPYLAVDAGAGRSLTSRPTWYATFGTAYNVGIRSLIPLPR